MCKIVKTKEQFIEEINYKYNNSIDTTLINYINNKTHVLIPTLYGICKIVPMSLLKSFTPTILSAVNPTEYWINMAKEKHENLYDYSLVNYEHCKKKVKIICPIHGVFEQQPKVHLKGCGCPKCKADKISKAGRKSLQTFLDESKQLHGAKYDYSLVKYTGTHNKIKIICPIHGVFKQTPHNHIEGHGCNKCGLVASSIKLTMSLQEFVEKANKKHNFLYNYSNVIYKNSEIKVKIKCEKHGNFNQTPNSHLQGQGCPKCGNESRSLKQKLWSYQKWAESALISKYFDSFKCYIIRCWNEEEEFYKIGKTYMTIKQRFSSKKIMPYNYEIVEIQVGTAEYISRLENILKKLNKELKYKPLIKFGGQSECFTQVKLEGYAK